MNRLLVLFFSFFIFGYQFLFFSEKAFSSAKRQIMGFDEVIADGGIRSIEEWLDRGNSANQTDQDGNRPIHFAAQFGNNKLIKRLLLAGADINATNEEGMTPLHIAIQNVQSSTVALLIRSGAKIDLPNQVGRLPIETAIEAGNVRIIWVLLYLSNRVREEYLNLTRDPEIDKMILEKIEYQYLLNQKRLKEFILRNVVLIPLNSLMLNIGILPSKVEREFLIASKIPGLSAYLTNVKPENIKAEEPSFIECAVCFDPIDKNLYVTPCLHIFHKQCLKETFEASDGELKCPLCRQTVELE